MFSGDSSVHRTVSPATPPFSNDNWVATNKRDDSEESLKEVNSQQKPQQPLATTAAIPQRSPSLLHSISTITKRVYHDQVVKCLLSALYLVSVMIFLSHLLVIVHYRMPKPEFWHDVRPLPDIILDWLPVHESGFYMAEILINVLSVATFTLVLFHAHSLVVLRRMFCVSANVFLLRSFSVIATSMPPSNVKLTSDCELLDITSVQAFVAQAFRIFLGMGMRATGGATCGDYVYSGHTCSLTVFNLFFLKYAPESRLFLLLKFASAAVNLAGMAGILVAHEHYSVDVLLAFAITYLVFNEYHHVAHHLQLTMQQAQCPDTLQCSWRERLQHPVTYFMESSGEGIVKNKLRIPFLNERLLGSDSSTH